MKTLKKKLDAVQPVLKFYQKHANGRTFYRWNHFVNSPELNFAGYSRAKNFHKDNFCGSIKIITLLLLLLLPFL